MIIILLAGPGSVGKTTQVKEMVKLAEASGFKTATHFSSTRKTYEAAGLTSESEALKDEEFNKVFQKKVFDDNCRELVEKIKKAKEEGVEYFFADRSPIDYMTYYFTVFQSTLTIKQIEEKRNETYAVIQEIMVIDHEVNFIKFPFPQKWSEETESSDGWRADKTGKNFIWSSSIIAELTMGIDCNFKLSVETKRTPKEIATRNLLKFIKKKE